MSPNTTVICGPLSPAFGSIGVHFKSLSCVVVISFFGAAYVPAKNPPAAATATSAPIPTLFMVPPARQPISFMLRFGDDTLEGRSPARPPRPRSRRHRSAVRPRRRRDGARAGRQDDPQGQHLLALPVPRREHDAVAARG